MMRAKHCAVGLLIIAIKSANATGTDTAPSFSVPGGRVPGTVMLCPSADGSNTAVACNVGAGSAVVSLSCPSSIAVALPQSGSITYRITMSANCSIAFTGGYPGQTVAARLELYQSSGGGFTPSFVQAIAWPGGTAPTWNTISGRHDVVTIATSDNLITLDGTPN